MLSPITEVCSNFSFPYMLGKCLNRHYFLFLSIWQNVLNKMGSDCQLLNH